MIFLRQRYKQKPRQWGPVSEVKSSIFKNGERLGIDPRLFPFYFPLWDRCGFFGKDIFGTPTVQGYNGGGDPEWRNDRSYFWQTSHGGLCDVVRISAGAFIKGTPTGAMHLLFDITGQAYSGQSHFILNAPATAYDGTLTVYYNNLNGYVRIQDTSGYYAQTTFPYVYGEKLSLFVAWDRRTPLGLFGFLNGVALDSAVGNGMRYGVGESFSSDFLLGARGNYNPVRYYGHRGNIDSIWMSSQTLIDKAPLVASDINDNPFSLLQRVAPVLYFDQAAGGSTLSPIEGNLAAAVDMSSTMTGKIGSGGGLLAQTDNLNLAQLGKEGQQGLIVSMFNSLISILSGKQGTSGILSASTRLSSLLFGNNDGADPQVVFEGALSSAAGILSAELFGNLGIHGRLAGQIIMAASLAGQLGSTGSYTIQLDGISSIIEGILGVSGEISATISAGADLAAKLGISGELISALDDLGLQLFEIIRSEKIYQIVISTTSGRVVFMAPKFGKIEISTII